MKMKSEPSLYRYCIVRLSTFAVSTLTPALNVLSTTLPLITFLSLVRTNAGPLPGLTCWNSTTVHSWPSRLRTRPFLRSFVDATGGLRFRHVGDAVRPVAGARHPREGGLGFAGQSSGPAAGPLSA